MPKIKYIDHTFNAKSLDLIARCNAIITSYTNQGYSLTLRQLYYQLVARDLIENTQKSYDRIGEMINNARLAGLIDWLAIEDRTRNLRALSHWESPEDIIESARNSFRIDKWARQERRIEVWVEKDALIGVLEGVCNRLDVPYFSCRGYTSQSELWGAARRLQGYIRENKHPLIIHLGDHDPSGKDMTRDINDRFELFMGGADVERIALNYDQIQTYNPPPNPAKMSDSRAHGYVAEFGYDSWELDALEPSVIAQLIEDKILEYRDEDLWNEAVKEENEMLGLLGETAKRWSEVVDFLKRDEDGYPSDEGE